MDLYFATKGLIWAAHDFSQSVFFVFLSFLISYWVRLWIFYSLGNSSISKATQNLQLCLLTSPRAIHTVSMKHVQDHFLALWTIGLKDPMSPLMNSYTTEPSACIQTTYWELLHFHANQWAWAKNPLAQDKIMLATTIEM